MSSDIWEPAVAVFLELQKAEGIQMPFFVLDHATTGTDTATAAIAGVKR
jgi:hypothetical protein